MKLVSSKRRMAVIGLSVGLIAGATGLAVAYFTTSGTGNGNAYTGTGASVTIAQLAPTSQVLYSSLVSPLPGNLVSQSFEATGTSEYGNQITLASPNQTLTSAVVTMSDWNCQTGTWNGDNCVTTPGTTYNEPITLTVYSVGAGNAVGSVLTSATQTFAIPDRPSADATNCTGASAGEWYSTADSACHNGLAFNITFNTFAPSVALPANVIYGISYSTTAASDPNENGGDTGGNPAASLNVGLTTEPTQPTVGSDPLTGTGSDYLGITTANGGGYANGDWCDGSTSPAAFRYDAGPCTGTSAINYPPSGTNYIPAVQFNTAAPGTNDGYLALVPGGPAQPVDFSITNNSATSPAYVQSVSYAMGTLPAGCNPAWFNVVQPTVPVDVTIPAGATVNFQPSGGAINLINEPYSQDACESADIPLTFTSN